MRITRGKTIRSVRGVTVLEVLIAVFVLLVGMVGVFALFPVGVTFSQRSADDIIGAMTAQNALAAVRVQLNFKERLDSYATDNLNGDVLSWDTTRSRSVDGGVGAVSIVSNEFGGDVNRHTEMGVQFDTNTIDDKTFIGKDFVAADDDRALMLMTSGRATWKLYRLDHDTSFTGSKVSSTKNGVTNFPGDGIKEDDTFRLIGARDDSGAWATVPVGFYENGAPYTLGKGAAAGYGYLAIVNRVKEKEQAYRVTILVYKGYDDDQPPEGNEPAIACYVTILSSDLMRHPIE